MSDPGRVEQLLRGIEQMAGGDLLQRLAISPAHDELDAIAYGVNALCAELDYLSRDLRRLKEEAEAANRRKSTFVRNLSHEIRTPLAAILGLAQLLASTRDDDAARRADLWQRTEQNGRALLQLLDEMLDLSKIEAGHATFERVPVALTALCSEVVRALEPEALRKSLQVMVLAPRDLPPALADPRRVRQILVNLIGNALKFTAEGEVRITLAQQVDEILIEVTDTGIGVPHGTEQLLFAAFTQANETIERDYGGTGLGLMLSRRLAEGMGGRLALRRRDQPAGTTVELRLPVTIAPPPPVVAAPLVRSARQPLAGQRLLLVEDDEDIREAIGELLRLLGATVHTASTGEPVLALVRASRFDVVLMDLRMPHTDGLAATRQLREAGETLPIVILTADAVDERRIESLAAGGTDWITKPVDLKKLVEVVTRLTGATPSALR